MKTSFRKKGERRGVRKALLLAMVSIFLCLSFVSADAAYKIILNNGAEITVERYETAGNEIKAYYDGGIISINRKDIRSIKNINAPATPVESPATDKSKKSQPSTAPVQQKADMSELQGLEQRLTDLDGSIKKIEEKKITLQNEKAAMASRYNSLESEARRRAAVDGKEPQTHWRDFLVPEDYLWVSQNESRIAEIDERIKGIDRELQPLLYDKEDLQKRISELK
ncbi:MAG TPA: hypothetical protein VK445_09310 [Dissulfurispiraceae bacterium]|nr:hypothetical protein [Dissulfurispiraceae bacterium]